MANIIVGFHKTQFIDIVPKLYCYFYYVDDKFSSHSEIGFFQQLNGFHHYLQFAMEVESNKMLALLEVLLRELLLFLTAYTGSQNLLGCISFRTRLPRRLGKLTIAHRAFDDMFGV